MLLYLLQCVKWRFAYGNANSVIAFIRAYLTEDAMNRSALYQPILGDPRLKALRHAGFVL
jgi:hypothetical protein